MYLFLYWRYALLRHLKFPNIEIDNYYKKNYYVISFITISNCGLVFVFERVSLNITYRSAFFGVFFNPFESLIIDLTVLGRNKFKITFEFMSSQYLWISGLFWAGHACKVSSPNLNNGKYEEWIILLGWRTQFPAI